MAGKRVANRQNQAEVNLEKLKAYIEEHRILQRGRTTRFEEPFLQRAFGNINKDKMINSFIKYYNSIFLLRIIFFIIAIISFTSLRHVQIGAVLLIQIWFTITAVWYQIRVNFMKMNIFNIISHFAREVSLVIFLLGAFMLAYNSRYVYSENLLFALEIIMTLSLSFSMILEMISLLGIMIVFVFKICKKVADLCGKNCRNNKDRIREKKKDTEIGRMNTERTAINENNLN